MDRKLNPVHLGLVVIGSVVVASILKAIFKSDWFEFAAFVTGVVAVYLVAVEHIINWPIGLVNVAIYGWVFYTSRLYADMSLQVFFFVLQAYGWYVWARGGTGKSELHVSRTPASGLVAVVVFWIIGTAIYYPIIKHFNGAAPFIDSTLTVGSIIAQVLQNYKKIETWILWILVDLVYIPLYVSRSLVATSVLYGLFLVLAAMGLMGWYKTLNTPQQA